MRAKSAHHRTRSGLSVYRSKRDFGRTSEPSGKIGRTRGHRYLIQKHAARRLHYDFRLELDGVLKSWAVTRGPSLDPADKRLAVQVEDHPLEYGGFEGTIPKGEYGGGTVMLWDTGTWEPLGDAHRMLRDGRLHFRLHGKKLKGEWHLVRMRGGPREKRANWLLIKSHDSAERRGDGDRFLKKKDRSVKTGRSLDEIAADKSSKQWSSNRRGNGASKAESKPTKSARPLKPGKPAALPSFVPLQLTTRVKHPPNGEGWVHEIKFDGYRAEARLDRGKVRILTRSGLNWTDRFPGVAKAIAALPAKQAIVDGEIIATGEDGISNFARLQQLLSEKRQVGVTYMVFDLMHLDGRDLRRLPLIERKTLLERLVRKAGPHIRYSEHFDSDADKIYRNACRMALEGLISKRVDDIYHSDHTRSWQKSKCRERQEFVIGGFTEPKGSRLGIGAIVLGYWKKGKLIYAGRVGTGFSSDSGIKLRRKLDRLEITKSPFDTIPTGTKRGVRFVKPQLVAEVEFATWTADGLVRQGAFIALRDDKPAKSIGREQVAAAQR
jgi:bifunctional non-homologous end joining protein LigD